MVCRAEEIEREVIPIEENEYMEEEEDDDDFEYFTEITYEQSLKYDNDNNVALSEFVSDDMITYFLNNFNEEISETHPVIVSNSEDTYSTVFHLTKIINRMKQLKNGDDKEFLYLHYESEQDYPDHPIIMDWDKLRMFQYLSEGSTIPCTRVKNY